MTFRSFLALAVACLFAACSTGEEQSEPPVLDIETSNEATPSKSAEATEPAPDIWVPTGTASATYDGQALDLAEARVTCETDGSTVTITVDLPDQLNTDYWATLWATDAGVDVLNLGIDYSRMQTPEDEFFRSWQGNGSVGGSFSATKADGGWEISGEFSGPETSETVQASLRVMCP